MKQLKIAPRSPEVDRGGFARTPNVRNQSAWFEKYKKEEQAAYLPFLRHWWSTSFSLLCYSDLASRLVHITGLFRARVSLSAPWTATLRRGAAARSAHDPAHTFHYRRLPGKPARPPPLTHTLSHTHKWLSLPRPLHTSPPSFSVSLPWGRDCTAQLHSGAAIHVTV